MKLIHFKDIDFLPAIKALFKELKVPMNYVADEPTTAREILKDTYKDNATFQLVDDVYFVGMVDDAAFDGNKSLAVNQIKSDYDGVLVFGITLRQRANNLLPTRSQLAEISRAFNREFYYTPVVLVFKYKDDQADYLAFANTERLQYKQAWREGEKAGKVSLLRDINIAKPHRGHEDIIDQLRIPTTGTKAVDTFAKLYTYWQEVFSVSVLNKKFYQELSNWYFWAVKHVTFPNKPTVETVVEKHGKFEPQKLDELIQEHNTTNVIRLLTRLLFTWFIKEKKLIPEALFDLDALQKDILKDISPYHEEGTMFAQANRESIYYKAILQNLFFASLNCPIEADGVDNRTRGFRGDGYGTHRGIDYLMRYKANFKNPDAFLEMMNQTVPFLNGGLFECLDDKYQNIYIDGFSDQMTRGEQLVVPDYLFFGVEEEVDLSTEYGVKNKGTKQAAVKGLINILKSYKFTITENTPIEEDVALDPELLGKVFENLLASYNPETKTTARKQTGSFYTPREIVNYMVDESLIAYLKNSVTDWGMAEKELDDKLHQLTSFDPVNPFSENTALTKRIVKALDECKILDPACGSGAFPMGILQKMVHILQKLDTDNAIWKDVQLHKAMDETEEAFGIENRKEREEKLIEINNAFDERVNDPDYARKLYLIENCVYGVDIQPIATQIAKLRFFISLVVDQKVVKEETNFGIRPLPNLETKFVTANTLIGIEKPKAQTSLFDTREIKQLEAKLKKVRHKLFSARTKDTKLKYRQKDEELRNQIADELKQSGWQNDSAEKLASWDPYDQNASSPFFDPEWMFDISEGFDLIIGNPPYITYKGKEKVDVSPKEISYLINRYKKSAEYKVNSYALFIENASDLLSSSGHITYIIPSTILQNEYLKNTRGLILQDNHLDTLVVFKNSVFEAVTDSIIIILSKDKKNTITKVLKKDSLNLNPEQNDYEEWDKNTWLKETGSVINLRATKKELVILSQIDKNSQKLDTLLNVYVGIVASGIKKFLSNTKVDNNHKPYILGRDIDNFSLVWKNRYINFLPDLLHSNTDSSVYNQSYKLLVRKTGNRLLSVLDEEQFYTDQSLYNLYIKAEELKRKDLAAINSILNSQTLNFYFNKKMITNPDVFPYIKGIHLKELPIKMESAFTFALGAMSDIIQYSGTKLFAEITNGLVFNLYFPDHMKEKEIDVLEFVERDMEKALQGREFDSLLDAEKEKVIEQLHAIWSHPDNEVRNRIKLFAVRSPEILKPILES
jgi:tRNA1(Val) A37 N6-methylase TrmN6